jgi:RNA polymerase sigma-70 factor (ECF subfamily)
MTDKEIINLILEGDRNLYRKIVERYQTMVFRICIGFLHNKDEADDLTQDVFIQAYASLSGFKGNSSFSTWLYRIALNACLNRTRKMKFNFIRIGENNMSESKEINIPAPTHEEPDQVLMKKEQQEIFQKALDGLKENQRTAIILSKYDDLSQREIAEIMNISEGNVESLLFRAKGNLREKLMSYYKTRKNKKEI